MRSERRAGVPVSQHYVTESQRRKKQCRHRTGYHHVGFFRRFLTGISVLVLVMSLSFGFGSFFSSAHDNRSTETLDESGEKYYKSIQIEKGDSLWSIAQQYRGDNDSVYEYMEELAEANHLSLKDRCNLQEGDYLVVSYSSTGEAAKDMEEPIY